MTQGDKPAARPDSTATVDVGGRPKGRKDKKPSRARKVARAAREVRRIASELGVDFFPGSALVLLQCVYKDPRQPGKTRLLAANMALPYESPRLSAVEHSGAIGTTSHEKALDMLREGKAKRDQRSLAPAARAIIDQTATTAPKVTH